MALVQENVVIGGVEMKKYYSDEYKKIQCVQDKNIYSVAYTTKNSTATFVETTTPINDITPGNIIKAEDIIDLSSYVENVIDMIDGEDDEMINVDLGSSTTGNEI